VGAGPVLAHPARNPTHTTVGNRRFIIMLVSDTVCPDNIIGQGFDCLLRTVN
jgi:hypothetical protein